jgi:hypothetical protein
MITNYKHIKFVKENNKRNRKTDIWYCYNNSWNEHIGTVKWYPQWRQYCFITSGDIGELVLAKSCCNDIAHFINQIMADYKNKKREAITP